MAATPLPEPPPSTPDEFMAAAGIAPSDWPAVDFIVSHEGGWCAYRQNGDAGCYLHEYSYYRAYGVCQALPGEKMASAGPDWMTNIVTQLRWCNDYAQHYGGWWTSVQIWRSQGWW